MAGLTNKQKKEWAKSEFLNTDLTQNEIAEKVGVSRVALSRWINSENWKQLKSSITISREKQIERWYRQIEELNNSISEREAGKRHATVAESNTLNNLAAAIKKLESETGLGDIINVSISILKWLRAFDHEKAKEVSDIFDAYIRETVKK